MILTRRSAFYFAPGITLDIETNHPVINSDASGVGGLACVGYEKRINKSKAIFFIEGEARLTSLWHFKKEDFPWRHANVGVNIGFNFIID